MKGWLMNDDGKKLENEITHTINGLAKTAILVMAVYCGVAFWFAFRLQIQSALRIMQGALFG